VIGENGQRGLVPKSELLGDGDTSGPPAGGGSGSTAGHDRSVRMFDTNGKTVVGTYMITGTTLPGPQPVN
jgi:hypothetical protein